MKTSWLKQCVLTLMSVVAGIVFAAETPVLKITKVQQRYPWNGLVDIDVTVKGLGTPPLYFTATEKDTGRSLTVSKLTCEGRVFPNGRAHVAEGEYRFVWNAAEDVGVGYVETNVVVKVANTSVPGGRNFTFLPHDCVAIDLSAGASATTYPVEQLPAARIWRLPDSYKTTKLLLTRIPAGSFMMQGNRPVTLTKDFHMGVFEVTQKQYELIMGSNPSRYKGDARPVEWVSWIDATNFCAVLSQRTGLNFTLPTEAQWEYACRAGTTTSYNNGTESIEGLGRCWDNRNDGIGGYSEHTTVGSYQPNALGLYDMHGNVCEWCLDWSGSLGTTAVTDPTGSSSGRDRILRGGSWSDYDRYCTSSSRYNYDPSFRYYAYGYPSDGTSTFGFRLVCSPGL